MAARPAVALLACIAVLVGVAIAHGSGAGAVIATIPVGANPVAVVADARSGLAFAINNGDNTVSVLDAATAALRRTLRVGSAPTNAILDAMHGRLAVLNTGWRAVEQGGQILAYSWDGSGSSSISLLDAASGQVLRTVPADVSVHGAIVDAQSWRVFVGAYDLHDEGIAVLRAATHRSLLRYTTPDRPVGVASDGRLHRAFVVSDLNQPGATLSVFDTATGAFVQGRDIGAVFGRRSLAADERTGRTFIGTVIFGPNGALSGGVAVFDTRTGTLLRTVAVPAPPGDLVVDEQDGRVFISGLGLTNAYAPPRLHAGVVTMLDANSGAVLHSSTVGVAPGPLAVDARHHHVLVVTGGAVDAAGNPSGAGTVAVLDARSGAVVRTITAGMAPGDIALDERANRAFVLNFGGKAQASDPWAWLPRPLRHAMPFLPGAGQSRQVRGTVMVLDTARL